MAANSYRNVFLTNIGTIPTSGNTLDLGIGQLGIVNLKNNTLTATPNFPAVRSIQIVQGTSDKKLPKGFQKGNQTFRTPEIPADPNIKIQTLPAQKLQNMIVTLGYDGVDTTKTMAPRTTKDVQLYITLTGQAIANLTANTGNHPAAITETFYLNLPCVDECADNCAEVTDCNVVADAIIKQVSERKTIGSINLVDGVNGEPGLLKLTKLVGCTPPTSIQVDTCTVYSLQVPDAGDNVALGEVQAQYAGQTITRVSRDGIISTYETTICPSGTLAGFQPVNNVLAVDCACPTGWTETESYDVYTVIGPGNVDASAVSGITDIEAGLTEVLSFNGSQTTLHIFLPAGSNQADTIDEITALGFIGTFTGSTGLLCTPPSGIEIEWADTGKECGKATKTYQLTLKDDCNGNQLAALQAIYGEGVSVVSPTGEATNENCTTLYQLVVESENTCVDCANIDNQFFTFKKPQNYGTSIWVEVIGQTPVYENGCPCGIRFESAYVARDRKECFFEDVSYEVEPLFIYVSTQNPDFRDYSTLCNDDEVFPVTLIQTAKYRQGYGSHVAEQVKLSNFYFNDPWFHEAVVRDAVGYELGVDLQGYYDQISLTWKAPVTESGSVSGFGRSQFEEYEWSFYVAQGESGAFLNALNNWLASVGAETGAL